MGFDKFKNFWNVDIKDGVEGQGRGAGDEHAAGLNDHAHTT